MHEGVLDVLIVDDEPLARKGLRKFLAREQDMCIVGECGDGVEAVEQIQEKTPDIVFLDIQMPGLDGFGVIDAIGVQEMPLTVFVTAYDLHALRAFDVHAIDYLLKPVIPERLAVTLDRARAIVQQANRSEIDKQVAALLQAMRPSEDKLERIVIKSVGKVVLVPVDEVDWITADGDYVKLHTPHKVHLLREKISILEAKLDPSNFIRIHRSAIVRIGCIRELRPLLNGDHVVILHNGEQLALSRTLRARVFSALQVRG